MANGFDLNKLSTGEKIMSGAAVLLFIDLLFFPWFSIDLPFGGDVSFQGVDGPAGAGGPQGLLGILALLLAAGIAAAILLRRLTNVEMPDDVAGKPWDQVLFAAGVATAVLLLLKLIFETDYLGFGAYLGIILGAAVAYGGFVLRQEGPSPAAGGDMGGGTPPL